MTAITVDAGLQPRRSFQEVWVVSIGHALTHWYPATFYLLLPLIGAELGLSYSQIGSMLTCQFAAGAISNIPGGIFVDTVGRKGLLMAVALFWIGFPYLMMGFSHAYWMMLGCATLLGIGNNLWHPTAIPWLATRFPERKGLVMSFHSMGGNVGDAVAPLVVGALLAVLQLARRRIDECRARHRDGGADPALLGRIAECREAAGCGKKPRPGDRRLPNGCGRSRAADRSRRGDAVGRLDLPHHDAERAADVPAGLSGARHGLFAAVDRRLHVRAAGRGFHRRADRRTSVRHDRPPADHRLQHVDDARSCLLA